MPFDTDEFFKKALTMVPPTKHDYRISTPLNKSGVVEKLIASADKESVLGKIKTVSTKRAGQILMSDMLITGFSSEEASTFPGGPDAYREELHYRNGTKVRPRPVVSTGSEYILDDPEEDQMETPEGTEVDAQLEALVAQYADAFSGEPRQFGITAPMKLITKKGKDYRNTPFIGAEEFVPVSAYIGKKGQTLIMLKPVDPCDFEYLEVPEKQCQKVFGIGFTAYMRETLKDALEQKEELAAQASRQNEIARNASAMEQYEGFGSW